MSLRDAQQRVDAWISQYEEGYFHPLTNICRLTEEVGELAREVNHRFGQKTKKQDEAEGDMAMEMADIVFVLVCMATREGIDHNERAWAARLEVPLLFMMAPAGSPGAPAAR